MEKIAIIDLGSNSARLVLVNVMESGHFVVFDELKESVRLGQDMERDGFLKPARVAQTIKTLKMFRRLCDANKIDKIYAFATSAVRRAKNQKSFLEEVAATCAINLKVLSQEEEGQLIYHGVVNSVDIHKALIVDIGGGSIQFIHYNRRNVLAKETLPFGAVTLTDMFKDENLKPEEKVEKVKELITQHLQKMDWIKNIEPDVKFIGVGGSFRNLGKISRMIKKYPLDMAHNYNLNLKEFKTIYDTIKTLDIDKTMKIRGLSSARADIFPAALGTIKAICEYIGFTDITVSGSGLREGSMFIHAIPSTQEKPITDVLGHSIQTMLNYFDGNDDHCEHVYNLSMQLFKQLKVLHKLPRSAVKVLRTASILHDAGLRMKYYGHHKHSAYIILNSNLYGISQKDLIMSAFVAEAHETGKIAPNRLAPYINVVLNEEDVNAIKKLGVILKIAESFDRSMSGLITEINCDLLGDSVIMKTISDGDCSLEIKDALSCSLEFRKAFGKQLEIL